MRLRALALNAIKNPHVGRKLPRMMRLSGLDEVELEPTLRSWTDFNKWRVIAFDLAMPIGLKMQAWSQEEADQLKMDLMQLDEQGAFYANIGYILVSGRKPQ